MLHENTDKNKIILFFQHRHYEKSFHRHSMLKSVQEQSTGHPLMETATSFLTFNYLCSFDDNFFFISFIKMRIETGAIKISGI